MLFISCFVSVQLETTYRGLFTEQLPSQKKSMDLSSRIKKLKQQKTEAKKCMNKRVIDFLLCMSLKRQSSTALLFKPDFVF